MKNYINETKNVKFGNSSLNFMKIINKNTLKINVLLMILIELYVVAIVFRYDKVSTAGSQVIQLENQKRILIEEIESLNNDILLNDSLSNISTKLGPNGYTNGTFEYYEPLNLAAIR